ncbi:MAG: ferritin-like domain-containing protein [Deltaproteobacteria bacterium]|nr:ferritin-like domain-containing protein [Deltaproteobacteria bacterium]
MHDVHRLRRALWTALSLPIAAGCTSTDPVPKPQVEPSKAGPTPPPDDAKDNVEAVERVPDSRPWACEVAHWCEARAEAIALGSPNVALTNGCPATVELPEGTTSIGAGTTVGATSVTATLVHTLPPDVVIEGGKPDCCYSWTYECRGGRPLVIGEELVVARIDAAFESWSESAVGVRLPAGRDQRDQLARAWLCDALFEHASIASFARSTLELMAVGAPASLLAETHRAALDEVRHAALCFDLAAAYGAPATAPGPLPCAGPRASSRSSVARTTFVEGCVGETVAALVAKRAASACTDPVVTAVLETIADDEARHAALAWKVVQWLLRDDDGTIAAELKTVWEAVVVGGNEITDGDGRVALAEYGRLGARATRVAAQQAHVQIVGPMLDALIQQSSRARESCAGSVWA